jgi:hypothetical protein
MTERDSSSVGKIQEIKLDLIDIGTAQVRTDLKSGIDDLAASIRKQGLLEPDRSCLLRQRSIRDPRWPKAFSRSSTSPLRRD